MKASNDKEQYMPLRFMSCFSIFITTFMFSCASGTDINYEVANNNRGIDVTSRLYKIEIRDVSKEVVPKNRTVC